MYALTDRRPVDTEAKHTGFFTVETTKVLATTVESLRDQNRLLVFSYKGNARVSAERTRFWLLSGTQELNVPAVVNYYLDLSSLSLVDVSYSDTAKIVSVRLPAITVGDIVFQPENASTVNGGVLTYGEGTVEALRRLNYKSARRAMVAQAQQPGLLNEARRRAQENIQAYCEIPLRLAGRPDVKVVATFR
ncbi:DUF4230 domain-containing protein [Sphingomonas sp. DC1100-1]|uniref:DUF4230 domain-containing protein n=1 Tax=unclassified Sphingomonas TaxID=196159 RepID=UPI003CF8710F